MSNRRTFVERIWGMLSLSVSVLLSLVLFACQMPSTGPAPAPVSEPDEKVESESSQETTETPAETAATESTAETEVEATERETIPTELLNFTIISESSEVRFIIDETLGGIHTEVTGVTSAVTGSLRTNPERIADTEFTPIVIDANTFVTDRSQRNRAIRTFVLYTNLYPEITFVPTSIGRVPDSVSVGEEFTLEITGPLQVLDTRVDVTFAVTAVFNSETELTGTGTATVILEEHGINVPMPPLVSWVDDNMTLEMDFHAVAE